MSITGLNRLLRAVFCFLVDAHALSSSPSAMVYTVRDVPLAAFTVGLTKLGVLVSGALVILAAIDPSIVSAVIAGCFMLINSLLIWYLTHRQNKADKLEQQRLDLMAQLMQGQEPEDA